jgi:hypothetical protein
MEKGIKPHAHFGVWLNHKGVHRNNVELYKQIGLIEQQLTFAGNMVMITPEEGKRLEMHMAQKLIESEIKLKEMAIQKQKFYQKTEGVPIATPVAQEPSKETPNGS